MRTGGKYVSVDRSETYYESEGAGEPLLLLHGGLGTVQDFASQTAEFAKHYRVLAFERSGHGHTADAPGPFTYGAMVEQTVGFIDAMRIGACNLVGWSDGAIVALLLAVARPDLVRRLVPVSASLNPGAMPAQERRWIEGLTAQGFHRAQPALAKRYDEASPDGQAHFPVVLEKTKRLWLNEPDISPAELAIIAAPTLVMAGDREAVPVEHTLEISRLVKGARLCIVPGATHFLLSEKPGIVNPAILDFLRASAPRP